MIIENWALKKVAEEISNLAFDYISSCLQENAHNVFTKIRLYHMKKRIKKWCDDFLIKHDGTVLTEGRFIRFLSTYRVFEEILTYSNANISDLSEDEFIKGLLKKTKTGISGKLSPTDEMLKSSPYLCVNSLRYILHLIRLLMIVAAVELSEPVYHAMLPTL